MVGQGFSYRWNFHLMAAKGYVVAGVNRRGLPGFGQAWCDAISEDWGGQAMKDLLTVTDAMQARPYVDKARSAAVGASFGGYTVFWLMGNAGDRFACMIGHCGIFNLESMFLSTEEQWFTNWDLGAPWWHIHLFVVMPFAKPGIASGCTLVFMLSAGALAAPLVLGGPKTLWFTPIVYDRFYQAFNWQQGSAYAIILLLTCVVFVMLMMRLFKVSLSEITR
jgi:pimeloyl-ACP methyl ester carboxylesterase